MHKLHSNNVVVQLMYIVPFCLTGILSNIYFLLFPKMPDIVIIFRNCSVGRKKSRFTDIDQRSLHPSHSIARIICNGLTFTNHISIEIRKRLKPVFTDELIFETL